MHGMAATLMMIHLEGTMHQAQLQQAKGAGGTASIESLKPLSKQELSRRGCVAASLDRRSLVHVSTPAATSWQESTCRLERVRVASRLPNPPTAKPPLWNLQLCSRKQKESHGRGAVCMAFVAPVTYLISATTYFHNMDLPEAVSRPRGCTGRGDSLDQLS